MPKRPEPPYFVLVCGDTEINKQLEICRNSEFHVKRDPETGGVAVHDRETLVLRTEHFGGGWLVWLHRKYYRHPFSLSPDGSPPPGVP